MVVLLSISQVNDGCMSAFSGPEREPHIHRPTSLPPGHEEQVPKDAHHSQPTHSWWLWQWWQGQSHIPHQHFVLSVGERGSGNLQSDQLIHIHRKCDISFYTQYKQMIHQVLWSSLCLPSFLPLQVAHGSDTYPRAARSQVGLDPHRMSAILFSSISGATWHMTIITHTLLPRHVMWCWICYSFVHVRIKYVHTYEVNMKVWDHFTNVICRGHWL